ncbi:hypothetical protein J2X46_000028 [Nocardioides sp. BE266]|uniref:hypothetical protein n=1 Tax=Nocardioides sp. BE266 TaxID=2817725 RepID=UPI002865094A|nr:hypothetical protein [Nocardioides sp. BE266]MDR7251056.1 hypothetical protein [Nocardioides sp. BE266]
MSSSDAIGLVCAALDPVMVAAGFQAGQGGTTPADEGQVIYCAGHDEFSERYPSLPQAHQQEPGGTCVDLVLDVWPGGRLGRMDLEAMSLAATLRHVGLTEDGDAVEAVAGVPVADALPVVAAALERLLG